GYGIQAYCCHPLISRGRLIGTLSFGTRRRVRFTTEEIATMAAFSEQVGVAMLRKLDGEALQATAREWQTTFDAVNDLVWLLDKDQRIIRCNRATEKLLNRANSEVLGRHCWEIVHGTSQPVAECPIRRAAKSLRRETMELQLGQQFFEVCVDPILDEAGQYAGAVHTVSDITERKRGEEQQKRHNEELTRFNRLAVGRELRMVELKQQVNELARQLGQPPPYPLDFVPKDGTEKSLAISEGENKP
ncbi:MAG: PAS domain S-box protein, partial [Verrucomicrobia bacterium]|nr:PAS domain S-box protein [Verrucomicrobiota bacterium]